MSDAEWAALNAASSKGASSASRVSSILCGALPSAGARAPGPRPTAVLHASSLLPALPQARPAPLMPPAPPPPQPRAVAESAAITAAVSDRAVGGPPLPPLGAFPSAAAATAALARDMNALADGSRAVRAASLSRICVCLTGVDWVAAGGLVAGEAAGGGGESGESAPAGALAGALSAT